MAYNYIRMLLTFSIGLIIIKQLINFDKGFYAVYTLVTIGLGVGVMIREIARAATVPFFTQLDEKSDLTLRFRQSVFVILFSIFVNFLLSLILLYFSEQFQINDKFKQEFITFFWLRFVGFSILMLSVPIMNLYAYKGKMGVYNLWLLLERFIDLIAVQAIFIWAIKSNSGHALIVNGYTYLAGSTLLFFAFLMFFNHETKGKIKFIPKYPDHEALQYIKKQIFGTFLLVLNMAFFFRLSLVLVNIFFGEGLSYIYSIAIQISSYLRQAIMGLITGVDSFFSRSKLEKGIIKACKTVSFFGQLNSILLIPLTILLFLFTPQIIIWVISDQNSTQGEEYANIVLLTRIFIVGVSIRSLSEHWMEFLNGSGNVIKYSKKIIWISALTPIFLFMLQAAPTDKLINFLGWHFSISMLISHLIIVPSVFIKTCDTNYIQLLKPILIRLGFYSLILLFFRFNLTFLLVVLFICFCIDLLLFIKTNDEKNNPRTHKL